MKSVKGLVEMSKLVVKVSQIMRRKWHLLYNEHFTHPDPEERLEEQIRALYGRGEITKDRFIQLRFRLHNGLVSETDLAMVHQEAIRLKEIKGNYLWRGNPELEQSLDRLYADKVWVEETHDQLKKSVLALQSDIQWVKGEAEASRMKAGAALPDEAAAREMLLEWQKLLSLSQNLESDLQALQHDLMDLDNLEDEIKVAIIELKLYRSREQIAGIGQHIRSDLLTIG
jgi:hypothetical protein